MLTIHDKIPTDMEYVKDNELYFGQVTAAVLDIGADSVISAIECGHYGGGETYIDRLGRPLFLSCLSTGCKTALNILYGPTICVDTVECGINAIDTILGFDSGNIYVRSDLIFSGRNIVKVCWEGHGCASDGVKLGNICREVWPDEDD